MAEAGEAAACGVSGMSTGGKVDVKRQRLIARLYRQGLTQKAIDQQLGIKQCSVCEVLKTYRRRRCTLSVEAILAEADAWRNRTGKWPNSAAGRIPGAGGDNWRSIDNALIYGLRGLPGGSSLARLLAEQRGVRNVRALPALTVETILSWADAHRARTGHWPTEESGLVSDAPGEVWVNIGTALRDGLRGLQGRTTLARLLRTHRGESKRPSRPALTVEAILTWADAHRGRTGQWPKVRSGPVIDAPGETWIAIDAALVQGCRGLPGGLSLARLLAEHRGVRNKRRPPGLTRRQIEVWAVTHRRRTGEWPTAESGPVIDAPGETWTGIQMALVEGGRGLYKRSSLHRVLMNYRRLDRASPKPGCTRKERGF